MTRPIATPAHAPARTRRRQRSFALLRSALVAALVVACLLVVPAVNGGLGSSGAQVPGPGRAEGQVGLSGLESSACMSFAPAVGQASRTVFIDPGHGGLDPGVVGE